MIDPVGNYVIVGKERLDDERRARGDPRSGQRRPEMGDGAEERPQEERGSGGSDQLGEDILRRY